MVGWLLCDFLPFMDEYSNAGVLYILLYLEEQERTIPDLHQEDRSSDR